MPSERSSSSLVRVSNHANPLKPFSPRLRLEEDEQESNFAFVAGNVVITFCVIGAAWVTMHYWQNDHSAEPALAPAVVVTGTMPPSDSTALPYSQTSHRNPNPQNGVVGGVSGFVPVQGTGNMGATLGFNEASLMLRAGYSDEDMIAAVAGKPLGFPMDANRERLLRGLGAGDRLIQFLRQQPISAAQTPTLAQTNNRSATSAYPAPVPARLAPAATYTPATIQDTVVPKVDYAARDREISRLKQQIDDLDERIRVVRTNPNNGNYSREVFYSRQPQYGRQQLSFDAHIKRLEEERDGLRRRKWQIEGR